ncbi:hypothetical protein [Kitasatospora sp. NBC_01300]|uniref:hypothetical protein n=1 Tax=Kitasatospora sp. NBC_01300 TaxID=2903574 RepID=UPI00352EBA49|nr:hypothetical protein OG556_24005 [Kitasatospora sp. NBC_01300]
MAVPRTLIAALLCCTAAAALAACTPADSAPTVAAASAAAVADGAYDDEDDLLGDDLADPEPSMDTSPAAPAADCATPTPTERPGHTVLVVLATEDGDVTAQPARYSCDEARYEGTGTPARYGFATAGVEATLVDRPHGDPTRTVRLEDVLGHLEDCLAEHEPDAPYGCYGNVYDVVLDSHGRIMRIGELVEP